MTEAHDETLCNGCSATDDHPKIHIWGNWVRDPDAQESTVVRDPSFHFDCLPEPVAARLEGKPDHARTVAAREAALSGTHGQDLRDHIADLPDDNNVDTAGAEDAAEDTEETP